MELYAFYNSYRYAFCNDVVRRAKEAFPTIDILVNNAAEQHPQKGIEKITSHQLIRTFQTNIFSMFYLTKAVLPHLKKGSSIINTTSITAYAGNERLIDYSGTKSMAQQIANRLHCCRIGGSVRFRRRSDWFHRFDGSSYDPVSHRC